MLYKVYTYFKQKCNIVLKLAFQNCYSVAVLFTKNYKLVIQNSVKQSHYVLTKIELKCVTGQGLQLHYLANLEFQWSLFPLAV